MAKSGKRGGKAPPRARRETRTLMKAAAPGKAGDASLKQQLAEARAQQAATAKILKVIASSPSDVQPVFDAIAQSAQRLIRALGAAVTRVDGDAIHLVALTSIDAAGDQVLRKAFPQSLASGTSHQAHAIRSKAPFTIEDVEMHRGFSAQALEGYRARGVRALLAVPMMRGRDAIGTISVSRGRPGAFNAHQIGLLQTFADQAVIAIQNARLFNETREALERQTATAGILRVISGSPTSVQPVFDSILQHGTRLCEAQLGFVFTSDGEAYDPVAQYGLEAENYAAWRAAFGEHRIPGPLSGLGRLLRGESSVHIADVADEEAYRARDPLRVLTVELIGARTFLAVPLVKESAVIGAVVMYRREVRPFADKQVELLQTFADQAVIAIENVRLFNETREALEQQTAISEVLRVIAGSPAEVQPVLQAVAERATRICEATDAQIFLVEGQALRRLAGVGPVPAATSMGNSVSLDRKSVIGRAVVDRSSVHVRDIRAESDEEFSAARAFAEQTGWRTALAVPLMREERALGVITLRRFEVQPFTDKQIALLRTFADQAAIAIENARLFNETKEALERQTATAEILKVIASSPSSVQPVFDAIARSAMQLIGGFSAAVVRVEGDALQLAAFTTTSDSGDEALKGIFPMPISGQNNVSISVRTCAPRVTTDIESDPEISELSRTAARARGWRAGVAVPMLRDGQAVGAINVTRRAPGPFSDHHVKLLQTFADQAVIAIENVRLFNETKEALERQTATAEILKVIASSPSDVQPVFDAIVRSCHRLFNGEVVALNLVQDSKLVPRASTGAEDVKSLPESWPLDRGSATGTCVLDGRTINIADTLLTTDEFPRMKDLSIRLGYRSGLYVPLRREGTAIGAIVIPRKEVGAFTDREVSLAETFADQAVIAIQNVRLFKETQEALARQAAATQVLRSISESVSDTAPVFAAILDCCNRLIPSIDYAQVQLIEGSDLVRLVDHRFGQVRGAAPGKQDERRAELMAREAAHFPRPLAGSTLERALNQGRVVILADTLDGPDTPPATLLEARRWGHSYSQITVPLMREGRCIGAIEAFRRQLGGFEAKESSLLESFADQAVIAIENVRLFNETKEALERQTATSEILRVISSTPTDAQPVFDAIVGSATRIFNGMGVGIIMVNDGRLVLVAAGGTMNLETARRNFPMPLNRDSVAATAILDARAVNLGDTQAPEAPQTARKNADSFRSIAAAPMLREGVAIGAISVTRKTPGALGEKELALLQTFADQAVIAIENARLFNETREALERQTATAEILKVIASTPSDVQPVFDAIASSAARLFVSRAGIMVREGDWIDLKATAAVDSTPAVQREGLAAMKTRYPLPFDPETVFSARVMATGQSVVVPDTEAPGVSERARELGRLGDYRSFAMMPLLREGSSIGVLAVTFVQPGILLTDKQLELLRTFADQAVIAIENVRLFNETKEALERQTATGEILSSMSGSMTDAQPVFDAIARNLLRLFGSEFAIVALVRDEKVEIAGLDGVAGFEKLRERYPVPLDDQTHLGKVIVEGRVSQLVPIIGNPAAPPSTEQFARDFGYNAQIGAPMIREGQVIGAIVTARREAVPFDEKQISLIRSFADQAVIAIENMRLFNETKEALEKQTATAEILRVISNTPTDTQPVFEAIVRNATKLCEGAFANVFRFDGALVHWAASDGWPQELMPELKKPFPMQPNRSRVAGRVILDGHAVRIEDTHSDPGYDKELTGIMQYRRILGVPLLREGKAIGAIVVGWVEPGSIQQRHEDLLKTFADQAVIAIENVRLFNETKEALERQTATAEILRVISSSPTDTQPVFDAIVQSGLKLFSGASVAISIVEGGELRIVAAAGNLTGIAMGIHLPISRESASGLAIVEKRMVNIKDTEALDAPPHARDNGRKLNIRSMTLAPMFREGEPIGVMGVALKDPGGLDDKQVTLLKTFTDQAVIAIENVRLFKELQAQTEALTRSVGQLTALGEVGQAISSTLDLETVLKTIVIHAVRLTGLDAGVIYEFDEAIEQFQLRASENFDEDSVASLRGAAIRRGEGAIGRSVETRAPTQVPDTHAPDYPARLRELLDRQGFRAILAVPLFREDHTIGALMVIRKVPGTFAPETVELLKTFATQSAMAIQNARLFREIAEKGKEIEIASQHKSQFLASMSHELRTPLNAILGFNEMILGQIYGEVPADMQVPLADIQTSGKHLLRLINNVLDLAKIEAGRMELSLQDYSVHDTVASVHSTLRPLAAEKGLEFLATVPDDVPLAYGDGGRMAQCLMNLAGNSLKFTRAGTVEISVGTRGELLVYKVTDTGIGIPPEKIGSLFTEFKQTDATIASEYGGTGLGLSISRKFVEMHGGRIWVESELGKGSAFIIEVPLRAKAI